MTKDEIQEKITELENSRDQLIQQFYATLGEIRGRLAVYHELLDEEDE